MNNVHCPIVYYDNCRNAAVKCQFCKAVKVANKKFYYDPFDPTIEFTKPVKDERKSKQIKDALARETKSAAQVARVTLGSGRIRHDGDIIHLNSLRVERKTRYSSKSLSVTAGELAKGRAQGIDVFEIELVQSNSTYYVLPAAIYLEFLSYVYRCQSDSEALG